MTEDRITGRLRELRHRVITTDPLMNMVINVTSRSSFPPQIGLVVITAGARFRGVPSRSDTFARTVDDHLSFFWKVAEGMAKAEGLDREFSEEIAMSPLSDRIKDLDNDYRAFLNFMAELDDFTNVDIANFPPEMASIAVEFLTPPKAFTLTNAQVSVHGGRWEDVPDCRIVSSHVEAWWTFELSPPDGIEVKGNERVAT